MDTKEVEEKLNHNHQILMRVLTECPEIVLVGTDSNVLRTKSLTVSFEQGIETASEMKKVLEKYRSIAGFGRGLAAPQIGKNESVFVTFLDDKFQTYINPKIIVRSADFNFYKELCLSCAYIAADVKRPRSITIEYTNELGEQVTEEHTDFTARLLQHEYDHLEGILNIDVAEKGGLGLVLFNPLDEKLRDER